MNIEWYIVIYARDGDGVPNGLDNCIDLPNGDQADADGDKTGQKTGTTIILSTLFSNFR